MSLRQANKVVVLLGAGASYEAGIPTSPIMIDKLEALLSDADGWQDSLELYNYVKSAIYYADGITGKFNSSVNYNIERLVNALSELDQKTDHPLYPFIGNWNIKLIELGGTNFEKVRELKQKILGELSNWVLPMDYSKSKYYEGLFKFAEDYQYPLRLFSLNYDMCVERNRSTFNLERGFKDTRQWDWKNFDEVEGETPDIFLYKIHGSIDWYRDENKNLSFTDEASKIKPDQFELIFGTNYKMQYTDPFLFFAYEFRRWTLEAKLIIVVGYGFGDEHINGILGQALENVSDPSERKLLAVSPFSKEAEQEARERLASTLKVEDNSKIEIKKMRAKEFISQNMTIDILNGYFPSSATDIF